MQPINLDTIHQETIDAVCRDLSDNTQYFKVALVKALWAFYLKYRGSV